MATSTTVIEMNAPPSSKDDPIPLQTPHNGYTEAPRPGFEVVETKQRWNDPRINTYRLASIFFAFITFGMNDGSYGALIPYVSNHLSSQAGSEC